LVDKKYQVGLRHAREPASGPGRAAEMLNAFAISPNAWPARRVVLGCEQRGWVVRLIAPRGHWSCTGHRADDLADVGDRLAGDVGDPLGLVAGSVGVAPAMACVSA